MTIIAWDGKTLSADKMTSFGGLHATTMKLRKIGGCLVGGAGATAHMNEMLKWIEDGCDAETLPSYQRDPKECVSLLVIGLDGKVKQYESSPYPLQIENKFWAIGSGRDFAMAAMYLGKTSREAVKIASELCNDCGNGIDSLELN